MYKIVDSNKHIYNLYNYQKENEFEKIIVNNHEIIFGAQGIYFDLKKKIGISKKGAAVPDGYYLDHTFHHDPQLYFIEVELNNHDLYGHIGEQILRFSICSETDKHKIKTILLKNLVEDINKNKVLEKYFEKSKFNNINELLDEVIFEKDIAAIVVINEATPELDMVLSKLTITTEVIEVQTYTNGNEKIHRITPFRDEISLDLEQNVDADELDTIVVPAREDGFKSEFIDNERWYAIRISSVMLDKIKYIAVYQVAPVSGITYIAEVEKIEKYRETNKYMVIFKSGSIKKLEKISLGDKRQGPQAPRYTSYKKIFKAKYLNDLWN